MKKGEFRSFMSDLHLWIQAWSDHGERVLTRVESAEKIDRDTLAVDCTQAEFRALETALYQVLHRTTANEPLKMVQQVEGQRGFEAWHLIVRRYDQRNTSDKSSAYAALVSNINERDRAKDVEQFEDVVKLTVFFVALSSSCHCSLSYRRGPFVSQTAENICPYRRVVGF